MRLQITGSRHWARRDLLWRHLSQQLVRSGYNLIVVHGDCPNGADRMADQWCAFYGVPVERHPAEWRLNGKLDKSAGHKRNSKMAELNPDYWLGFWTTGCRGTKDAVIKFADAGIPGFIAVER